MGEGQLPGLPWLDPWPRGGKQGCQAIVDQGMVVSRLEMRVLLL